MTTTIAKAVEVFYSYAQADEELRDKLEKHLSSLQRRGLITTWHHRRIIAGSDYAQEIDNHLNTASLILLLVSSDFISSDYCYGIEIKRAVERHESKQARVIPILLRPVEREGTPFEQLQVLPESGEPITTWLNEDEAFLEVTRGIRKAIQAWTTPSISTPTRSERLWNIPYQRNPYFTGQEAIITLLHNQLTSHTMGTPTVNRAISGLGGIGKTQLAIEYAYRYREEYQAVLWAKADTRESLVSEYIALATLLGVSKQDEQDRSSTVEAVKDWLNIHDRWLLILDNADDIMLVRDFLPGASIGHILLTTRAAAQGTIAQGIEMEPMEPTEGALFLLRRTRRLASDADLNVASLDERAAAQTIVQALGGLPLALDQAGAYIEETGCGLSGYLDRYRAHRPPLLKRRGRLAADHLEPVATTWSLAFLNVELVNSPAAEVLRLCAFLHPDAIPEELITAGASELGPVLAELSNNLIALDEAVETLRAYSLVGRHPDTRTLSIHRLVQAVLRDGMAENEQRQRAEQVIRVVNQLFPSVEFDNWPLCERYLLHAQAGAMHIMQWKLASPEAARLLDKAGTYLYEHAQYSEAEPLYQRALAIREQILGPKHADIASSLNSLGELYCDQGKYTEGEQLYQRALTMCEHLLGSNHPDTARCLNNLADLYQAQEKYAEAEQLYQRALNIREQMLGPNHSDTALSLNNLGMLYEDQGKYDKAEPLLQRALSIREKMLGPNHPRTALSFNNLAALYYRRGKYADAEPLFQRALSIREKMLRPNHPSTANSLGNLAALYYRQGKYADAEPLLQRALAIREQMLGFDHPDTALSLNNLAKLYEVQGKYVESESLYQRALAIYEQKLGADHHFTAMSLNNLAKLYEVQSKDAEAEPLYHRSLTILERKMGVEHPDTVKVRENYAALRRKQER